MARRGSGPRGRSRWTSGLRRAARASTIVTTTSASGEQGDEADREEEGAEARSLPSAMTARGAGVTGALRAAKRLRRQMREATGPAWSVLRKALDGGVAHELPRQEDGVVRHPLSRAAARHAPPPPPARRRPISPPPSFCRRSPARARLSSRNRHVLERGPDSRAGVARSSSASGVNTSLCRNTGAAIRATSSGVTYAPSCQPRGGLRRPRAGARPRAGLRPA